MSDPRDWRDARFKKALEHAPDLAERPLPAVREAILSKARASAAQAGAAAMPAQGKRRGGWLLGLPWNSALGTVAVVALVSVLWWREDLPRQAEQPSSAAPATVQEKVAGTPVPPPKPVAVPAERVPPVVAVPTPVVSAPTPVVSAPTPVVSAPTRVVSAPAPVVAAPAQGDAAPEPALSAAARRAAASEVASLPAPPPPPPPVMAIPAPAQSPVLELNAGAASRAVDERLEAVTVSGSRARARATVAWTQLRVRSAAGPVLLTPDELAATGRALLQQHLRAPPEQSDRAASDKPASDAVGAPPAGLVVEVLDGEQVVARLVLTGGQLHDQIEAALASKPR